MLKPAHLFKSGLTLSLTVLMTVTSLPSSAFAAAGEIKKDESGLYTDIFDQNLYYEGTNMLHLDRLYRFVAGKKVRALDVNQYDEVPDSSFFVNRHAKKALSKEELAKGYSENEGPDFSQGLTITSGKFNGTHPGFFAKDSKGDSYFLKFDAEDSLELQTSTEMITSRFLYALGYNVSQYTLTHFTLNQVKLDPNATVYDDSGFQKKLNQERFEQYITFVPQNEEGQYRAVAIKQLAGEDKGVFRFHGKRSSDSNDLVDHERMRALRALRVFGSWLNMYDIREGNTKDMLVSENGKQVLKHYLVDFQESLGSSESGAKPPMFNHEHLVDYGESGKSIFTFGFWKKPWQKRWTDAGENLMKVSPAVGYFDNRYFHPAKFKTQLPHYAFKDLSRADAFWAAKQILSFSDEDIRAIVATGKFSQPEDAETISKVLIERRDIIGKFWFGVSSALDDIDIQGKALHFKDLGLEHKYWTSEQTKYHVDFFDPKGKKPVLMKTTEISGASIDLSSVDFQDSLDVMIRTIRTGSSAKTAGVVVQIRSGRVAQIIHQD